MIIRILVEMDFPKDKFINIEGGVRELMAPWPPMISTHPPSIFLWNICPGNKGTRDIICLLIGVEKAMEVNISFKNLFDIKNDENLVQVEIIIPKVEPKHIIYKAWSFKIKGSVLSAVGAIIIQDSIAPINKVPWDKLNIGKITKALILGWNILAGRVLRGDQETFVINRIVYIDVSDVANKNNIIRRYELGLATKASIIKSFE